jgi:hypothetical protein
MRASAKITLLIDFPPMRLPVPGVRDRAVA